MTDKIIVFVTCESKEQAETIAQAVVTEKLAACVNVLPPMTSVYRWKGAIEEDREQQLVIKTTSDRVAAIEARFRELHPYELPEFVILDADASAAYLAWMRDSLTAT